MSRYGPLQWAMLRRLERLVDPYPETTSTPPRGFAGFLWDCTRGLRPYLLALIVFTALLGAFEAFLFSMLGSVVDWLAVVEPSQLWKPSASGWQRSRRSWSRACALVALQSTIKQQVLFGNFPMLLRWSFHKVMLGQSMSFYQDEFAGRIATKLMQTALAVRDTWLIFTELLVFVVIYFVTLLAVLGGFDLWLIVPFAGWVALYVLALWYFVPRLGRIGQAQADARSLMTGRITDAYTNIATVKLFSHARRESTYARGAMQEFLATVYAQMRLVTGFEIVNHMLSMGLIASTAGAALLAVDAGPGRRRRRRSGDGDGAAPQRHLALGDVGDGGAVRVHRDRARRHRDACRARRRWSIARTRSRFTSRAARSASST